MNEADDTTPLFQPVVESAGGVAVKASLYQGDDRGFDRRLVGNF